MGHLSVKHFCAFEEQLHALTTAKAAYCVFVTCQVSSPISAGLASRPVIWIGLRDLASTFFPVEENRVVSCRLSSSQLKINLQFREFGTDNRQPSWFRLCDVSADGIRLRNRRDVLNLAHIEPGGGQSATADSRPDPDR